MVAVMAAGNANIYVLPKPYFLCDHYLGTCLQEKVYLILYVGLFVGKLCFLVKVCYIYTRESLLYFFTGSLSISLQGKVYYNSLQGRVCHIFTEKSFFYFFTWESLL